MSIPILTVRMQHEQDTVTVRQRTRQLSRLLGFDPWEQTRVATAVSEIARNALTYAGGGRVEYSAENAQGAPSFVVRVVDSGPGIRDLNAALNIAPDSPADLRRGIVSARRLMDEFAIDSQTGRGTSVVMKKRLPVRARPVTSELVKTIAAELAAGQPGNPLDEIRTQNQELMSALEEMRRRQEELARVNAELEDTNRGVVALYAELDERADHLRRADELKSRFLSNMSHEFRSPLNSIMALSGLLLQRVDGPLSPDQEQQVKFIRKAAQDLSELVNDLLDLAKVEAGKVEIRSAAFEVESLFGALRGMFRPLLTNPATNLVFVPADRLPPVVSDEAKVSQILRNLISNALKFTEQGEVRVSAVLTPDGHSVLFTVADTGIGIAPTDLARIFEDFVQVDSHLQRRVTGTGLGLPLSRKLAALLGGELTVESEVGVGSTFQAVIPRQYGADPVGAAGRVDVSANPRILIIDDEESARYLLRQALKALPLTILEASGGVEGLESARSEQPHLVILDLMMPDLSGYDVLVQLKSDPATRQIPVVISTSQRLSVEQSQRLEAAAMRLPKENWNPDEARRVVSHILGTRVLTAAPPR